MKNVIRHPLFVYFAIGFAVVVAGLATASQVKPAAGRVRYPCVLLRHVKHLPDRDVVYLVMETPPGDGEKLTGSRATMGGLFNGAQGVTLYDVGPEHEIDNNGRLIRK